MFIKPSKDLKDFEGGIIPAGNSVEEYIKSCYWKKGYEEVTVLISPIVQIYAEYRFFILDKKVVTGSMYKRGKKVIYDSFIPEYMLKVAEEFAKIYQPSEIFVMDLAETDGGIKIVEYNCLNCSGLYNVDSYKLFSEVNEFKKH